LQTAMNANMRLLRLPNEKTHPFLKSSNNRVYMAVCNRLGHVTILAGRTVLYHVEVVLRYKPKYGDVYDMFFAVCPARTILRVKSWKGYKLYYSERGGMFLLRRLEDGKVQV